MFTPQIVFQVSKLSCAYGAHAFGSAPYVRVLSDALHPLKEGGEWMTQSTITERREDVVENDLVPAQWKSLFNNAEWLVHRIVVQATYGMVVIVLIAHLLTWLWRPWLS
jgi:light-harvesting complex 1 beta chain